MHFKSTSVLIIVMLALLSGKSIAQNELGLKLQRIMDRIDINQGTREYKLGRTNSGGVSASSVGNQNNGIAIASILPGSQAKLVSLFSGGLNLSDSPYRQFDKIFGSGIRLPRKTKADMFRQPRKGGYGVSASSTAQVSSSSLGVQQACGYMLSNIIGTNPSSLNPRPNTWPSCSNGAWQQGLASVSSSGSPCYVLNFNGVPQALATSGSGATIPCFGGGTVSYQNNQQGGAIFYQPSANSQNGIALSCPYARPPPSGFGPSSGGPGYNPSGSFAPRPFGSY